MNIIRAGLSVWSQNHVQWSNQPRNLLLIIFSLINIKNYVSDYFRNVISIRYQFLHMDWSADLLKSTSFYFDKEYSFRFRNSFISFFNHV